MAKVAVILHEGSCGPKEIRLSRILDFFGVPWEAVNVSSLEDFAAGSREYVLFGSIQMVAAAVAARRLGSGVARPRAQAYYGYASDERAHCTKTLRSLLGDANLSLQEIPPNNFPLTISDEMAEMAGPMSGLKVSSRFRSEDSLLMSVSAGRKSIFATLISVAGSPVFLRFEEEGIPVFLSTTSHMLDIDQPVTGRFYDVKDDFCSVVPLVTFIKFMFADVAWRPQELGACLIIDDPLLRPNYGFCNFAKLRDLMGQHGFTTNIAFIPWNWRRTAPADSEFFRNESAFFSVSIHGCDHTAGEFGASLPEILDTTARLARSRMRRHEERTGIQHDLVMVFPQGVFSSACPLALKRNGYLAAVNTETVPVDRQNSRTRIRDVWDLAIMTYDGFPIFTRRYPFHGVENFAFDLLLGKPCLIVAHHDFFKNSAAGLISLIDQIGSLNCRLHWSHLGDVIRRACRRRTSGVDAEEVEMYGNELLISNSSDREITVTIRKRKGQNDPVSKILCDEKSLTWAEGKEYWLFDQKISPREEKRFRVVYHEQPEGGTIHRSLQFELSVAARRILSELRDDYLSKAPFLRMSSAR